MRAVNDGVRTVNELCTYLAPLKRAILERKAVMQRPIRPGTISAGMKTEAAEARLSIILGANV